MSLFLKAYIETHLEHTKRNQDCPKQALSSGKNITLCVKEDSLIQVYTPLSTYLLPMTNCVSSRFNSKVS
jgi:hypothetical protein